MRIRKCTAALVLALAAGSAAQASTILTVTASYDNLSSANTLFFVENNPSLAESDIAPLAGAYKTVSRSVPAGAFEIYQFNETNRPFIAAPIAKGPVDTSVPLPSALLLMVSGLFGVGTVTQRRG